MLCGLRVRCIASMLATLVALRKERDAKAELNRRSQVCDALAITGVRVAKMAHQGVARGAKAGRVSGYRALYSGLEDRRVSLNTHARRNGVPSGSCTRLSGFADRCLGCSANGTKWKGGRTLRLRPRILRRSAINAAAFVAVTGSPLWPVPS